MAFTVATTRERTGNLFALYRRAKKREKGGKKREGEGEKKKKWKNTTVEQQARLYTVVKNFESIFYFSNFPCVNFKFEIGDFTRRVEHFFFNYETRW